MRNLRIGPPPTVAEFVGVMRAIGYQPSIRDPRSYFGLTAEEFADYSVIRAKGFSQHEAAEIVIRSRRSAPPSEA
jgi:hypothetical protein